MWGIRGSSAINLSTQFLLGVVSASVTSAPHLTVGVIKLGNWLFVEEFAAIGVVLV